MKFSIQASMVSSVIFLVSGVAIAADYYNSIERRAAMAFERMDRNRDNFLSEQEAGSEHAPEGFASEFKIADRDGDGKVSVWEFGQWWKSR